MPTSSSPARVPLSDGRYLLVFETLRSTQDEARARLGSGEAGLAGVQALHQSAGKGRRRSAWFDRPGECLLVTYVIPKALETWRLSFAAAVAVAEAAETLSGLRAGIKWPNDVLLRGRKVAGILVEISPGGSALVGIGLNTNIEVFPSAISETATSLRAETGCWQDLAGCERRIREALAVAIEKARLDPEWLLDRWKERDATTGRTYAAELGGRVVSGIAVGISGTGELALRLEAGEIVSVLSATASQ